MATAIPPALATALPPAVNEFAPFARASVFGDVRDLYRHAPTARIGANYTPSAHARLLERRRKAPPVTKRTGLETNAEILRMPAPVYPSAADMSGRDPKTGARGDPRAAAAGEGDRRKVPGGERVTATHSVPPGGRAGGRHVPNTVRRAHRVDPMNWPLLES